VAAVVIGVFYQLLSGQNIAFGLTDRSAGLRGIFSDKNAAARVYAYGLILFIGLGKYKKKSEIIRLSILLLAVMLSQSASAVILAFLGCSLIFTFKFFRGKNKKQNATRIIIIMIVLVSGALIAGALYEYLLELLGRDSNLTNRAIIWELLTPFLESKPVLGYGFGSFWASDYVSPFLERWGFIGNSHSGYFETMLNGGLVGLCLLIALISLFAKYALSNYALRQSYKDYSELLLAILISQAVLNYIGFIILNHNSVDMYVFLLAFFTSAIQFKGRNYS
jgi:O-antigen ligase